MTDLHHTDLRWAAGASVAGDPLGSILVDISTFIRRYTVLSPDQLIAVTLWVAHTHAIAAADTTPYLQITSAMKQSGKTRLLEVLEHIVLRAWLTGRTSAAALVRKVDAERPTLLLDESDTALKGADPEYTESMRGLLNTGYKRSGRSTLCVKSGADIGVKDFSTFSPKAIAGIGDLPDTIADRSIRIELKRRALDEPVARWRERDGYQEARPLFDRLSAWAGTDRVMDTLRESRPDIPSSLSDRASDVWEPLVAIADLAGRPWPEKARTAAITLAGTTIDTDITVELLRDLSKVIAGSTAAAIAGSTVLEHLTADADRPWAEWRHGKPMSARGLARLLAPLGIIPDRHDTAIGRVRGYRIDAIQDAVSRYLRSEVSNCPNPNKTGGKSPISTCPPDLAADTSRTAKTSIDPGQRTHGQIKAAGKDGDDAGQF